MQFSKYGALVGFLGYAAAEASPALQPESVIVKAQENEVRSSAKACSYDLSRSWVDKTFYSGIVSPATEIADAIELGLALPEAALEGSIDVSCGDDFLLAPTVKVDLGGIKAYLRVALDATAGVAESVNLLEDLSLSLAVPGLAEVDIDIGIALDLVFSVSAAIDIDTIFNVQFPEGCYLEINILSKEIVKQELTGLIIESLPQSIGAFISLEEDIDLNVGLRLRTGLGIKAGLDILGLSIGAGAEVAIWANLFEYTSTFSQGAIGSGCSASEEFSLTAGVAVELDVEIGELDLSLAPDVIVTLSTAPSEIVTVTIGEGSGGYWPWRIGTTGSDSSSSGSTGSDSSSSGSSSSGSTGSDSSSSGSSSSGSTGSDSSSSGSSSSGSSSSGSSSSGSTGSDSSSSGSSSSGSSSSGSSSGSTGSGSTGSSGSDSSSSGSSSSGSSSSGSFPSGSSALGPASLAPSSTFSDSPVGASGTTSLPAGMTTSTVYETHTYTMTSCAASVKNCPNTYTQQVVTAVVESYTTICPVTATENQGTATQGASIASGSAAAPSAPATSTADVQSATATSTPAILSVPGVPGTSTADVQSATASSTADILSVPGVPGTSTAEILSAPGTSTADVQSATATAPSVQSATAAVPSVQTSTVVIPSITSSKTLTPCATPSTTTQVIPTTVTTPSPTVVITQTYTPAVQTQTVVQSQTAAVATGSSQPKPTGAAWSDSPIYTTGPAPAWPSGAASPTGFSTRPYNGTISRPSTGLPVPPVSSGVPVASSTNSPAGQATPSAIVTGSAGKVGFGMIAAFAPLFVALM